MSMKHVLLLIVLSVLFPALASAQDVNGQCKIAAKNHDFETEVKMEFCDYYDRRFDYKKRRDEFRENLEQRRANYQAQRQVIIDDYQAKEDRLHGF